MFAGSLECPSKVVKSLVTIRKYYVADHRTEQDLVQDCRDFYESVSSIKPYKGSIKNHQLTMTIFVDASHILSLQRVRVFSVVQALLHLPNNQLFDSQLKAFVIKDSALLKRTNAYTL